VFQSVVKSTTDSAFNPFAAFLHSWIWIALESVTLIGESS